MTRDETYYEDLWFRITGDDWPVLPKHLVAFAEKVEIAERERLAQAIEAEVGQQSLPSLPETRAWAMGRREAARIVRGDSSAT